MSVMKQFLSVALLVVLLSACGGESAAELRGKCLGILNHPDLSEFYHKDFVDRWRKDMEGCGLDKECLQISYDQLAGKLAVAQEELPKLRSRGQ